MGFRGQVGYVPLTEIAAYCALFEVDDIEQFVIIIRHLDAIYVVYQNDKLTPPSKK